MNEPQGKSDQLECTHNRLIANVQAERARFPWKCADCGQIFGESRDRGTSALTKPPKTVV